MKLLITGGHPAPALACIDAFKRADASRTLSLVYAGKKYISADKELSFEYKEVSERDVDFIEINPGRFTRILSLRSFVNLVKIPFGIIKGFQIVITSHPDAVLSFGGYVAFPVACAAFLMGIPVYTHEQTMHPGLANRIIARFAKKVFTSFPESEKYLPYAHVLYTGNPVREQIFQINEQLKKTLPQKRPLIFITGGSLGSHSINVLVEHILPELLTKYAVIHQTGNVAEYNDFSRLTELRQKLPPDLAACYYIIPHISGNDIGTIFSVADIVIGRAGANTFFDVLSLKKPTLFIPLPWAAYNEQEAHAMIFKKAGTGEIFNQFDKPEDLLALLLHMISHLESYKSHFTELNLISNDKAATTIYKEIIG